MKLKVREIVWSGLVVLAVAISACSSYGPDTGIAGRPLNWPGTAEKQIEYPPLEFAHRVASPAVELFWNCSKAADTLQFTGVAFNQWFAGEVQYLDMTLVGVDTNGHEVSQGIAKETFQIFTLRYANFEIPLKATGTEVRYDLYYQYQYREPGDRDTGGGTKNSKLQRGAPFLLASNGSVMLAQVPPTYFLARDVCSPGKLRNSR
ncbi:MAG TPA: hypothetical protein VMD08_11105 [Candidatus Baltobacteraceae bacterium]|nr:hypothetical protein [Candidatus Baltobacteraceae bacterium]